VAGLEKGEHFPNLEFDIVGGGRLVLLDVVGYVRRVKSR
jgi:hypothetical protein